MSFDDLLSLASVFSGDIRRSLLALQVRLETGSNCRQKVAAPVYGPVVTADTSIPVDVGNDAKSCRTPTQSKVTADATKPSESQPMDSGDEFVVVRKRKRRALTVMSSDEDSQSLGGVPMNIIAVVGDNSSQKCEDPSSVSAVVDSCQRSADLADGVTGMVADQLPVALEANTAPLVYRLDFAAVGGLESLPRGSHIKLQVG